MSPLARDRRKIIDIQHVQRKALLLAAGADDLLQSVLQRNLRVQTGHGIGLRLADHDIFLFLLIADIERASDDLQRRPVVRVHRVALVAQPDARLLVDIRAQVKGKCLVTVLHAVAQRGEDLRILLRDQSALAHGAAEIRNAKPVTRRHSLHSAALHQLARRNAVLPKAALHHTADDAVLGFLLLQFLLQLPYSFPVGSSRFSVLFHTFLPTASFNRLSCICSPSAQTAFFLFSQRLLRRRCRNPSRQPLVSLSSENVPCTPSMPYGICIALATLSASSAFSARSNAIANSLETPIPLPVMIFPSVTTDSPVTVAPSSFSSKPG